MRKYRFTRYLYMLVQLVVILAFLYILLAPIFFLGRGGVMIF